MVPALKGRNTDEKVGCDELFIPLVWALCIYPSRSYLVNQIKSSIINSTVNPDTFTCNLNKDNKKIKVHTLE